MMNEAILKELFYYDDISGGLFWRIKKSHRTKVGDRYGHIDVTTGYRRGSITLIKHQIKMYYEHRLVWMWHGLSIPEGMQIDHINHDRNDNRIENLRVVTNRENGRNKSGVKGKRFGVKKLPSGNWAAEINNKTDPYKYLGTFKTKAEAVAARIAAEKLLGYHKNHNK